MIKILDCTLRDGGYYTSWNFNDVLVSKYLRSLDSAKIDAIELGFRFPNPVKVLGSFASTTDSFIDKLDLPKTPKYCVMVNAADFNHIEKNNYALKSLFKPSKESKISMVRVAVNFNDFERSKHLSSFLNSLGYEVAINLMQAHSKDEDHYVNVAKEIDKWKTVDVLYFADSFGSMDSKEVSIIAKNLRKGWTKQIGFHSHNNMGRALENSLQAVSSGLDWVDSTIKGMGRGAGNTQTEKLLKNLSNLGLHGGDYSNLKEIEKDFSFLKKKFKWGSNKHYKYASLKSIHPTYVQNLLAEERYTSEQIKEILIELSQKGSTSYDPDELIEVVYHENKKSAVDGDWNASGWLKDQEVLLIGPGRSVREHKDKLEEYIKNNNLKVFFLNNNNIFPKSFASATIISHIDRAMIDLPFWEDKKSKIIAPYSKFSEFFNNKAKNNLLDYGLIIDKEKFEIEDTYCKLFTPNVSAYALAIMYKAGVKKVFFAGLDGYEDKDERNKLMEKIFFKFKLLEKRPDLISLTPTFYKEVEKIIL